MFKFAFLKETKFKIVTKASKMSDLKKLFQIFNLDFLWKHFCGFLADCIG